MSATIGSKKMKFAVFGRGFEDTRNDSGSGFVESTDNYSLGAVHAVIDETNEFVWFSTLVGVKKRKLSDMSAVTQTVYTGNDQTFVGKPYNVASNIGVLIAGANKFFLFDMTDDTIIQSGTQNNLSGFLNRSADCQLIGDNIYLISTAPQADDVYLAKFNITDGTSSCSIITSNVADSGFMNDSSFYCASIPVWFSDHKTIYAKNLNGSTKWSLTASEGGSSGFPNIGQAGFCGHGKFYLPTYMNSAWRIGEFSANHTPNVITPRPIRTFGKFSSRPDFMWGYNEKMGVAFNSGKTDVVFLTSIGLFRTDFNDVEKLSDSMLVPLAINDNLVVARNTIMTMIYVFHYR